MPRPGPRRPLIAVRLSAEEIAAVDALAVQDGLVKGDGEPNRSEMIRRLIGEALGSRRRRYARQPKDSV